MDKKTIQKDLETLERDHRKKVAEFQVIQNELNRRGADLVGMQHTSNHLTKTLRGNK